jgi:hypothetical protein
MKADVEIIQLVLCVFPLLFLASYRRLFTEVHNYKLLIISFYIFLIACIATNLEVLFLESYLNLLEHICYMASAVLVSVWYYDYLLFTGKK